MTTVYQYFQDRADQAFEEAQSAVNVRQAGMFLAESDQWRERSGVLTVAEASTPWYEFPLWRVIQECDTRLKELKRV
jgi:type IV secretory pathway TraG/TraD family ATPase VirD4